MSPFAYVSYFPTIDAPCSKVHAYYLFTMADIENMTAAGAVFYPGISKAIFGLTYADFAPVEEVA